MSADDRRVGPLSQASRFLLGRVKRLIRHLPAPEIPINMRTLVLSFTVVLLCLVAGCGRDSRLQGKWEFDRAATEAELDKRPPGLESSKGDVLGSMQKALASTLIPTLIEKLDGSTLTITEKEMILTVKNGTGRVDKYEVIDRPAKDVWRVKTTGNNVEIYTRRGYQLTTPAMGDVELTVCFQRAK